MAIGKAPLPALLRRRAPRASARPDIRGRKLGLSLAETGICARPPKNFQALPLRRPHSRKRNVKPVLTAHHNTVPARLPTDFQDLGASSLNRPAPPWPSGF